MQPRPRAAVHLVAVALVAVTACTRSERSAPPDPEPAATEAPAADAAATGPSTEPGSATAGTSATSSTTAPPPTLPPTVAPITVVDVDEIGTPGLDSDDAFCSAWSRFAGSFQVVSVTAAFGSGPPVQLAALEIAASPTVVQAYDDLFANWPEELTSERELVADRFLGPFARRLADAAASLSDVGATDDQLATIGAAWLDGLARRDPSTPEFVVDLPDETWATIDAAAAEFAARRVAFGADPSLVTDVDTPLTREYLAVSCPDQGTLSGQEVDAP